MSSLEIPRTLPHCELLQILAEKASHRHDIDFNFLGRLEDFRQRVSEEVRQINELFPEYTPHDEQYHLKRLFHVASTVLGRERLEEMDSAELFVLAITLYGHDWGMAVSDPEKQYIVTNQLPEGTGAEDLWVLPDERSRIARFARKQQLTVDAKGCLDEIPIEMWREYVRQTHAFRSGERVRRYFEPIDGGVAEAAARICEGHWLEFEDLQDPRRYPAAFSVLRETVNLRALAIYLRLTDLLDLAEDRTPYVIWKFVAPRDPRSKMEWAKHGALRPVTCRPYQKGRVIQVDGSTDDHEVFAALKDLQIECEKQLRGCSDVLDLMNDPRHRLDIYGIEWKVAPRGFKDVSVQFEFDRGEMFELLGDEIYRSDPYVFLRELLQNSIDAIRMRREVLRRKGLGLGDCGVIDVAVEHGDGGDVTITWKDDGIGMDERTVRQYLAVAGKSYYHSWDFKREKLELDPISRFGIGILSCFMVADRVQIETFKDPYMLPSSEPLKITIPDMRRQFRIEVGVPEVSKVGTTVHVFVNGKKLPREENEPIKRLDVTAYLSEVAGFVEFPILVIEGDRKTIILHPKQDGEAARRRFGEEFQVQQLDLRYPWTQVILPQDLSTAREVLREEYYDLSSNLDLDGYEGSLAYLVPIDDRIDLERETLGIIGEDPGVRVIMRNQTDQITRRIRWHEDWAYRAINRTYGISRSSSHPPDRAVYRDGILLSEASRFIDLEGPGWQDFSRVLPLPRLRVNLTKPKTSKVDLARTQLLDQSEHWTRPIFQVCMHDLFEKLLKGLPELDPLELYYQLGRLVAFHNVEPKDLWRVFPHERWSLPLLEVGGQFNVVEWQEVVANRIFVLPDLLEEEFSKVSRHHWSAREEEYRGPLAQWMGKGYAFPGSQSSFSRVVIFLNTALEFATHLWRFPIKESHRLAAIQFLRPPWKGNPPLVQQIWIPMEIPKALPDIETILEKAIEDPVALNPFERSLLRQDIPLLSPFERLRFDRERPERLNAFFLLPESIEFPPPFEQSFAYGWELLNLKHPITQTLFRFAAALELSRKRGTLPEDESGKLRDALLDLFSDHFYKEHDECLHFLALKWEKLCSDLRRIWSLFGKVQLVETGEIEELVPTPEEFIPGTILIDQGSNETIVVSPARVLLEKLEDIQPFGEPLTKEAV